MQWMYVVKVCKTQADTYVTYVMCETFVSLSSNLKIVLSVSHIHFFYLKPPTNLHLRFELVAQNPNISRYDDLFIKNVFVFHPHLSISSVNLRLWFSQGSTRSWRASIRQSKWATTLSRYFVQLFLLFSSFIHFYTPLLFLFFSLCVFLFVSHPRLFV